MEIWNIGIVKTIATQIWDKVSNIGNVPSYSKSSKKKCNNVQDVKLELIGCSGVGKSAIVKKYVDGSNCTKPTKINTNDTNANNNHKNKNKNKSNNDNYDNASAERADECVELTLNVSTSHNNKFNDAYDEPEQKIGIDVSSIMNLRLSNGVKIRLKICDAMLQM